MYVVRLAQSGAISFSYCSLRLHTEQFSVLTLVEGGGVATHLVHSQGLDRCESPERVVETVLMHESRQLQAQHNDAARESGWWQIHARTMQSCCHNTTTLHVSQGGGRYMHVVADTMQSCRA